MRPERIKYIIAIADHGSIRAAASALNKSQPALSKVLHSVEDSLGVKVFDRLPRGVAPTDIGQIIIDRARSVLNEMRRLEDEVEQIKGNMAGSLHVIVSPLASTLIVPKAVNKFRIRYPNVLLRISAGDATNSLPQLMRGDVDLIVGPIDGMSINKGFKSVEILNTDIIVITGRGSNYATATSVNELQGANWLMIGTGDRTPYVEQYFRSVGLPKLKILTLSDSTSSHMAMLENSNYLSGLPEKLLTRMAAQWEIVKVPIKERIDPISVHLVYCTNRPLTPAGEWLRSCIAATASDSH